MVKRGKVAKRRKVGKSSKVVISPPFGPSGEQPSTSCACSALDSRYRSMYVCITSVADLAVPLLDKLLERVIELLKRVGLALLALEHEVLLPRLEDLDRLLDVVLDGGQDGVHVLDQLHRLVQVGRDGVTAKFKLQFNTNRRIQPQVLQG